MLMMRRTVAKRMSESYFSAPVFVANIEVDMTEQCELLNSSKAEWMHFDVMDGHFVKNLTFGPDILKGFVKLSPLFKDVHLMVTDPKMFADVFMNAGADTSIIKISLYSIIAIPGPTLL